MKNLQNITPEADYGSAVSPNQILLMKVWANTEQNKVATIKGYLAKLLQGQVREYRFNWN